MLAAASFRPLDSIDGGAEALLGEHPTLVREIAHQHGFEALMHLQGTLVIAQHISGKGESELGDTRTGIRPPGETFARMAVKIMAWVEPTVLAVFRDDDGNAMIGVLGGVGLHALAEMQ